MRYSFIAFEDFNIYEDFNNLQLRIAIEIIALIKILIILKIWTTLIKKQFEREAKNLCYKIYNDFICSIWNL